jgi:hypothetical protein
VDDPVAVDCGKDLDLDFNACRSIVRQGNSKYRLKPVLHAREVAQQSAISGTAIDVENTFKSGALDTGDQFSFTPTEPGTYSYFCSIHPKMTAKLVVE